MDSSSLLTNEPKKFDTSSSGLFGAFGNKPEDKKPMAISHTQDETNKPLADDKPKGNPFSSTSAGAFSYPQTQKPSIVSK